MIDMIWLDFIIFLTCNNKVERLKNRDNCMQYSHLKEFIQMYDEVKTFIALLNLTHFIHLSSQ